MKDARRVRPNAALESARDLLSTATFYVHPVYVGAGRRVCRRSVYAARGATLMAVCNHCGREMETATSCIGGPWTLEGKEYAPVPYGQEGRFPTLGNLSQQCDDCGVALGGVHHLGCRIEACPRCGGQLLTCGCADTAPPSPVAGAA